MAPVDYAAVVPRAAPQDHMPLYYLKKWNPFRIDALGLITLLGEKEVNEAIGTLERRRWTEYLPLLAAFVVTGNRFTAEEPGYGLYNVTDGIYTTQLMGWFTRWPSTQKDVKNATTIFEFTIRPEPVQHGMWEIAAPILSFVVCVPLLVLSILAWDWFSFANIVSIIFLVLVRIALLSEQRMARDKVLEPKPMQSIAEKAGGPEAQTSPLVAQIAPMKTLFVTRADGKMVTIYAPPNVVDTFTRRAKIANPTRYRLIAWIGWLAFGVHIIVLGMCSLFAQIYTVVLLLGSTMLRVHHLHFDSLDIGTDEETIIPIGRWAEVKRKDPEITDWRGQTSDRRVHAWARADLDESMEMCMDHWFLFPSQNVGWKKQYHDAKKYWKGREKDESPVDEIKHFGPPRRKRTLESEVKEVKANEQEKNNGTIAAET